MFLYFFDIYKDVERLYQDNKQRVQKKLLEDIKVFLRKKKKKKKATIWLGKKNITK